MTTELPTAEGPRPDRCETCRFWDDEHSSDDRRPCHRFPPTLPAKYIEPNEVRIQELDPTEGFFITTCADDWCGEWQGKRFALPAPANPRPPKSDQPIVRR